MQTASLTQVTPQLTWTVLMPSRCSLAMTNWSSKLPWAFFSSESALMKVQLVLLDSVINNLSQSVWPAQISLSSPYSSSDRDPIANSPKSSSRPTKRQRSHSTRHTDRIATTIIDKAISPQKQSTKYLYTHTIQTTNRNPYTHTHTLYRLLITRAHNYTRLRKWRQCVCVCARINTRVIR